MKLTVDAREAFAFADVHASNTVVVAIDPGARSGWCVRHVGGMLLYGYGDTTESCVSVREVVDSGALFGGRRCRIGLLVVEAPFNVRRGANAWKLPWAGGEARGRLADLQVDERALWTPMQQTWRSVLGLAGKKGEAQSADERVHAWAEATTHKPLRLPGGGPDFDVASAIGLCLAGFDVCSTLRASANTRRKGA